MCAYFLLLQRHWCDQPTPLLLHPSLPRTLVPTYPRFHRPSFPHTLVSTAPRFHTPSFLHTLISTHPHSYTPSFSHTIISTQPQATRSKGISRCCGSRGQPTTAAAARAAPSPLDRGAPASPAAGCHCLQRLQGRGEGAWCASAAGCCCVQVGRGKR